VIAVPLGLFEDVNFPEPTVSIYERHKRSWVSIDGAEMSTTTEVAMSESQPLQTFRGSATVVPLTGRGPCTALNIYLFYSQLSSALL
jgi:hypothetical protein